MNSTSKLKLDKAIFWDVDFSKLDWRAHRDFIIGRVLAFGDLPDFRAAARFYGRDQIKTVFKNTRNLDPKSANFWQLVL